MRTLGPRVQHHPVALSKMPYPQTVNFRYRQFKHTDALPANTDRNHIPQCCVTGVQRDVTPSNDLHGSVEADRISPPIEASLSSRPSSKPRPMAHQEYPDVSFHCCLISHVSEPFTCCLPQLLGYSFGYDSLPPGTLQPFRLFNSDIQSKLSQLEELHPDLLSMTVVLST
jgi:hypothetical protein